MANMIMASSRALITASAAPKPKPQSPIFSLPKLSLPKLKPQQLPLLGAAATFTLAHAPPSLAADIEKAALFD
uniref:hypothetical protein n=1 Tax=Pleomorphochaeta sp. DL1XJH-081 TaxID=3409690 RepID=UPI003BB7EC17